MKLYSLGAYSSYYDYTDLFLDKGMPPDLYGKYLVGKKRKKYKPRNKGRK